MLTSKSESNFWIFQKLKEYVVIRTGPDRLELIIFDIIGKKFYNHPSRLQL